jgi:hypothetical protein
MNSVWFLITFFTTLNSGYDQLANHRIDIPVHRFDTEQACYKFAEGKDYPQIVAKDTVVGEVDFMCIKGMYK